MNDDNGIKNYADTTNRLGFSHTNSHTSGMPSHNGLIDSKRLCF